MLDAYCFIRRFRPEKFYCDRPIHDKPTLKFEVQEFNSESPDSIKPGYDSLKDVLRESTENLKLTVEVAG